MPPRLVPDVIPLLRRALLCCIVVGLAVQGGRSTLVQLLGPDHRHEAAGPPLLHGLLDRIDAVLHDIRAWRADLRQRLVPHEHHAPQVHRVVQAAHHPHAPHGEARAEADHAHHHPDYQRHHHHVHDPSVIAIDAAGGEGSDAAAQAASGSATMPLSVPFAWPWPLPLGRPAAWPEASPGRWADAPTRPSERPPRA